MNSIAEIADIVELQTWAASKAYSVSALKEELEAVLPEIDNEEAETCARQVFEELIKRAQLLRLAYPFTCDGVTLIPNDRILDSSYLFCLGLTWFESITLDLRTREFEAIVKVAAEEYFGGKAVRIGAPWRTKEITDYEVLLKKVSDLIPDIGPPTQKEAPSGGDAGWDVVVANNFEDRLFSRIIALGNCATGKTNWRVKGIEVQPTMFWSFFKRPPQSNNVCLTFFAVPFLMTEKDKLRKAGQTCITFDRIRICEHAPSTSTTAMEWLNQQKYNALEIPLI